MMYVFTVSLQQCVGKPQHTSVVLPFGDRSWCAYIVRYSLIIDPYVPKISLTLYVQCIIRRDSTDLDYPVCQYSTEGKIKEPNLAAEIGQGLLGAVTSYARGDMSGVLQSAMGIFKSATSSTKAEKIAKATRTSPADVVSLFQWKLLRDR